MKKIFAIIIAVALCAALCLVVNAEKDPDTYLITVSESGEYTTGYWMGPNAGYPNGSDVMITFETPNAFDGFAMAAYASASPDPAVLDVTLFDENDEELETVQTTVDYDHNKFGDLEVKFSKAYAKGLYTIQMTFVSGLHFVLAAGDVNPDIEVAVSGTNNNQHPEMAPAIILTGAEAPAAGTPTEETPATGTTETPATGTTETPATGTTETPATGTTEAPKTEAPATEKKSLEVNLSVATNSQVDVQTEGGKIVATTAEGATDPWIDIPLDNIDTTVYKSFIVRYSATKEIGSNNTYLKDTEKNPGYSGTQGTWTPNGMTGTADGEVHEIEYKLSDFALMEGTTLTGVRLTACGEAGGVFTVESITFVGEGAEDQPAVNPKTADAAVIAIAAVAAVALAGVVVARKVRK